MQRLTRENGQSDRCSQEQLQQMVQRLKAFEDFYFGLLEQQETLSKKLAVLREQDKTKTAKFRELMGQKLQNTAALIAMKAYGLE